MWCLGANTLKLKRKFNTLRNHAIPQISKRLKLNQKIKLFTLND